MPAVFVHGVPDTHRVWMPVVDRLSRDDVVALDLPGFGSGVPDGFAVTKDAYVDWLIEAIARIGEPVDLVGHDWGCALTARVASLRPDLVRSWAGGGGPVDATYEWHPLAKVFQAPGRGEAYFARFDAQAFAGRMEQDGVPRAHADDTAARIDATMQACILRLYRSAVTMGAEWQPGLAAFRAPALRALGRARPELPGCLRRPSRRGRTRAARAEARRRPLVSRPTSGPDRRPRCGTIGGRRQPVRGR